MENKAIFQDQNREAAINPEEKQTLSSQISVGAFVVISSQDLSF